MWECLLNLDISYPGKLCYKSISPGLIFPYINNGVVVRGLASKRFLDKILRLQKRALRNSAERNDHATLLFVEADVLQALKFLYISNMSSNV